MTHATLREAIDLLLQEAYDGPPNPDTTLFVNNHPDAGVLGTVKHLNAEQAWYRPDGLSHSVAEHLTHMLFALNHASQCAAADQDLEADWEESWSAGEPDEAHWQTLQRQLREAHLRMRMWVHADETFATKQNIARLLAAIAHAAYHLGAIRQVAALAVREAPAADPAAGVARPL